MTHHHSLTSSDAEDWPDWYKKHGATLVSTCLVLSLLLIAGYVFLYLTRGAAQEQFLRCSDERDQYAAAASQTLRDATQARDDALEAYALAFSAIIRAGLEERPASPGEVDAIESTSIELTRQTQALRAAQDANPVVPAASVLCRDGRFTPPEPTHTPTLAPSPFAGLSRLPTPAA